MREASKDGLHANLGRWLELWFMVVCNIVNL